VLVLAAMVFLFILAILALSRFGESKKSRTMADEEVSDYQTLLHGFQRMEERIEALETILMDQGGRSSKDVRSGSDSFD
jgi:phage shock protein B